MLLDMPRYQEFHGRPVSSTQIPARDEMLRQRPGLVVSPRLKGSQKLTLVDQTILKRKDPEEEVSR